MTEVGFDGAQEEWVTFCSTLTEDTIDGVRFNWVTNLCSSAVSFDKAGILWGDACTAVDISDEPFLSLSAWVRDTWIDVNPNDIESIASSGLIAYRLSFHLD